jgi:SP family general alpha glucoside:H+ symporter-like MFS transporter
MAFLSQITDGGALCYSGTFFFQQTGIDANTSYAIGLAGTGIAFCGTSKSRTGIRWVARV